MQMQPVQEEKLKQNLEVIWTWLLDENVSSIGIYDVEDKHRRADQLNWAFRKRKNIVIILDDVWDRLSLEKLGYPLGVAGCKLILTSRSSEVCQKMGCKELLEVKKLNTETRLSPDIERIAKSMAGRCEGLPLGLITLGGSMSGLIDMREWKNALKEFPDDLEDDVFKVPNYSYDRLRDTTMQECFLYCALYPEDDAIGRDELIGRFIMEGLLMDLPSSISNLESLTALSLRGCGRLKSVPPLGKLKNLRVLDVFQTGIKEVPQGMENLVKLKFLDMGGIDLDDLASLELLEEFRGGFCDLHSFHKFTSSHHNYVKDWWYNIFVGPPVSDFLLGGGFDDRIPKQRRANYRTLHH
ncbi:hypothetical protein CQW23_35433 [Capsicum baccatum]|uniref:NB-ARC domain-containing protein n=1 Tax=Capsicum baccatum TaxID=33114 RepID=A0A2G2UW11_CAPBA|nr:hypothetical protein CQW23_35433 [Capsicum baccatum]